MEEKNYFVEIINEKLKRIEQLIEEHINATKNHNKGDQKNV